jgi:hypothetical protein
LMTRISWLITSPTCISPARGLLTGTTEQ